jgi:FKBP12-rapamycin complex-associated protein
MPATLSARLPGYAGTLDEHMHLLLPALIRLFKVDTSVDIRRAAIKTLTRLIPRVQVGYRACSICPVLLNWICLCLLT